MSEFIPRPTDAEDNVRETVHAFLNAWMQPVDKAVEDILAYVADDFTGIGTGPGDYYPDRAAFRALIQREKEAMPFSSKLEVPWMHVRLLNPTLALAEAQLRSEIFMESERHVVEPRFSLLLTRRSDLWALIHCHFSMPDAMQVEGDTLRDALEGRNRELERQVAERTAELEAAQAQLVQSEKMASLGQLTAGIAHEIKNPLNFVNNFAGLSQELIAELEEETDPDERQALLSDLKTNAAKIEEHGKRADAIVRSMMEHSRSGTGERAAVDLNALVEEYAGLAFHGMRAQHQAGIPTINLQLADDVGNVELVSAEIGRVLINLINNAFDAVRGRAIDNAYVPSVRVATQRVEGSVEVCVEDNGPGMSEAVRHQIFEPFFTTKPSGQGTGLGLSISYDIVTQGHSGTLMCESTEGKGTVFRMHLPAS